MGEYARRRADGVEVKIGTCESMYYLRFAQCHAVQHLSGNVNPSSDDAYSLRFRFPWPDEDSVAPGEFEPYDRAVCVSGGKVPGDVDHGIVQFVAHAGYNVCLPCPEGPSDHGLVIHRNGFRGAVLLESQKYLRDGRLVPVCRCGGCGALWRVEEPADIEALALAFRVEGDSRERLGRANGTGAADRRWFDEIADRILQGARIAQEVGT